MEWQECAGDSVVCGAAEIPISPPVSATARITSSGFIRRVGQTARAPAMGEADRRAADRAGVRAVWSEEWERSTSIPTWFIRRTALRPKPVNPASTRSLSPEPNALASL